MSALKKVRVEVVKTGEEGDQGAYGHQFTDVEAKINYDGQSIGLITATLVNRQAIAESNFHLSFDEHSGDMEWIGSCLLENKHGRTRLQSLCQYDATEFDFLYITSFNIEGAHSRNSDITTAALYHFLRDPKYIKGKLDYGCVMCTIAAFVAPLEEDEFNFARHLVDPFLRNGFFQDPALIREDPDNAKILVASCNHWENPIPKSQLDISSISLISSIARTPSGKDNEILEAVEQVCNSHPHHNNITAIMAGNATYKPASDDTTTEQLASLKSTLTHKIQEGGSLAGSKALHAACQHNKPKIVKLLLDSFPEQTHLLLNSKDLQGNTSLVVAAKNACGRLSINGIDDTQAIDQLLGYGADKSIVDSAGMTAYGHFRKSSNRSFTHSHCSAKLVVLESKLCPPTGPTMVDMNGGLGTSTGFVDYGPEDDLADREMGRGKYASDCEDGEDSDY